MIYVALLRGINVGGNNKIDMKTLKEVFIQSGMKQVKTYINSGNIIFSSDMSSKPDLAHILEQAIQDHFGLSIKVLIRDYEEMNKVIEALPHHWTNDQQMKSDVIFLWDDISDESVLEQFDIKPGIDTAIYVSGAVLWSVDRKQVTRSGLIKLIERKQLYHQTTVRNVNTTRKIFQLMQDAKEAAVQD